MKKAWLLIFLVLFTGITISQTPEITEINELPYEQGGIDEYSVTELNNSKTLEKIEPHTLYKAINVDFAQMNGQLNIDINTTKDLLETYNTTTKDLTILYGDDLIRSPRRFDNDSFSIIVTKPGKYYVVVPAENQSINSYTSQTGECINAFKPPENYEPVKTCQQQNLKSSKIAAYVILTLISITGLYKTLPIARRKHMIYKISRTT